MAIMRKQSFVAVTSDQEHIRWLNAVFRDEGEVVVADLPSLERVRQILDLTGAQVVFAALRPQTLRQDAALIEGLVAVKPLLSVIAMADQIDNEMLLSAMRAGARDFIWFNACRIAPRLPIFQPPRLVKLRRWSAPVPAPIPLCWLFISLWLCKASRRNEMHCCSILEVRPAIP